ncbi:protein HtrL-like isoform X2 [Littorina saxatilis]
MPRFSFCGLVSGRMRRHACLLGLFLLSACGVLYTIYHVKPQDSHSQQGAALFQVPQLISTTKTVTLSANATESDVINNVRSYTSGLPKTNEVTVVTAYFNLGQLDKAGGEGRYTPNLYKKWMTIFGDLDNRLIVFADAQDTVDLFKRIRARYPPERTTIFLVKRQELWAFRLEKEIAAIYSQPNYPKHPPNTINPLYSCAMHAKFELVQRVIRERLYTTPFIAWLDIGLFRGEVGKNQTIHLTAPTDLDRTKVGYSEVNKFESMSARDVIARNKVWVGGASFVGTPDVVYEYCSDYRRAVRLLLDMKLMSTDQQVIYVLNQPSLQKVFQPKVKLQAYKKHGNWFYIGYAMKAAP